MKQLGNSTIDWEKIEPHEFESIIAGCFSKLGYSVYQTRLGPDGGVDVIADKFDDGTRSWLRFVIQVKRYKSPVAVTKVRELNGILEDFEAVKGILIGTKGFTQKAVDFEKKHASRLSLWGEEELLKLLKAANLLDSEGMLRKVDDPNIKVNRRNLICIVLRESRPKALKAEHILESLRSHHKVLVPERTIKQDLIELAEAGDIVELEPNVFCARVLDVEVENICGNLMKEIPEWDVHFDEGDISDHINKRYGIPALYVQEYMQDSIGEIIKALKAKGILSQIGDRYFTAKGLERFRNERLTKKQMRTNLIEFFKIGDSDLEKPISSFCQMNKPSPF